MAVPSQDMCHLQVPAKVLEQVLAHGRLLMYRSGRQIHESAPVHLWQHPRPLNCCFHSVLCPRLDRHLLRIRTHSHGTAACKCSVGLLLAYASAALSCSPAHMVSSQQGLRVALCRTRASSLCATAWCGCGTTCGRAPARPTSWAPAACSASSPRSPVGTAVRNKLRAFCSVSAAGRHTQCSSPPWQSRLHSRDCKNSHLTARTAQAEAHAVAVLHRALRLL